MSDTLTSTELKKRIAEILKDADLETTSAKKVRMQLEEDSKSDLTNRKEEIGKIIQEVIDDMEDEEDEEEEDEKSKNGDIRSPNKNGAKPRESVDDESEDDTPTKKPARRGAAVNKANYKEDSGSEEESAASNISEDEKPKKPAPSAGRGRGRGRGRPPGMASSPRKKPVKIASSNEGGSDRKSDSDFVADPEEDEDSPSGGPSDSDYEPDDDFKPKPKKAAARASGRRGVSGGLGSRRNRRGVVSASEESEEESSGEEWGKKRGSRSKGRGKRKQKYESESASEISSDDSGPPRKRGSKPTGFTKDLQLSTELAAVVGTNKAPRHEVVKQLWAYIKENNLQDPKNKQFAICDDKLMKVIGEKKFKCFGMAKYLKDHMS